MKLFKAEFPSRYGGNIRVYIGGDKDMSEKENQDLQKVVDGEKLLRQSLLDMQKYISVWQKYMKEKINKLVEEHGPLPAKAFPGRAAILIKLLNIDKKSISVVYEKPGSMKIGHYLPGTNIPIESDEKLLDMHPPVILNLAWHISKEIKNYLVDQGFNGEVIDIYSPNIEL